MYDILIVGAGPAGLAAAIKARQCGMNALVIEKQSSDTEKICGDGLTEKSIYTLSSLGITPELLQLSGANEIHRSIHFVTGERPFDIVHKKMSYFALRRCDLSLLLKDKALSMGARIVYNTPYRSDICAGHIIDATGCQGKSHPSRGWFPVGISAIIRARADLQYDTFYFIHHRDIDSSYCWAFPLSDELWNVGIWRHHNLRSLKKQFAAFETSFLDKHFKQRQYVRAPRGASLGTVGDIPPIFQDAFVCGDAAGQCDSKTGEGISNAMMGGITCIERIENNDYA